MLAARVRSSLTETYHEGAVAVVTDDGHLLASSGDIDRPFYLRSAAKPFQAHVVQESGAALEPVELAMVSASHRGLPAHVSLVRAVLDRGGLTESDLGCPPDWPISNGARANLLRAGEPGPRPIWHNCSGKHAGFLRACVANGWPTEGYLDPDHPLQLRIADQVSELGEYRVEPVGVDGCGAPVLRTTARVMALLFARLGSAPELAHVYEAMHRYPALIGCNGEGDTEIAVALNAVAKGGAQGCLGVGMADGVGIAVKSWDGLGDIAVVGAVATLSALGRLTRTARAALASLGEPSVLGGGRPVGTTEPRLELQFS